MHTPFQEALDDLEYIIIINVLNNMKYADDIALIEDV